MARSTGRPAGNDRALHSPLRRHRVPPPKGPTRGRLAVFAATLMAALGAGAPAALAQSFAETLDQRINAAVAPIADRVAAFIFYSVPVGDSQVQLIVVWLILAAVVFTIYFRFINFWGFAHGLQMVDGRYSHPSMPGEVTHFQALTAALSGTVGLGNIAGVAVAIGVGGPGAMLWMVAGGLFGMAAKFVECTLGVKYRVVHADGTASGGPMYYLSRGLTEQGWPRLGRFLAVFFAVMVVGGSMGAGNMFQANQAYQQFVNATGGVASPFYDVGWVFGLILATLVGIVIIGGIKSIVQVTERVVPFMGGIYVLSALTIIFTNLDRVPGAFHSMITEAFTPEAGLGGVLGVVIVGFQRSTFSNEAGIGSASIAYSSVRTFEPVSVGFISLLGPFIDTVIICVMTALVIVISGVYQEAGDMDGVLMTSQAFASSFDWFPYVLSVTVILFAFSTIVTWSYYSLKCFTYLAGETKVMENLFKLIFCTFTVIGAAMKLEKIIYFSDAMVFAMALPNILGLYLLAPGVRRDLKVYWSRYKRGEIPVYPT